MEPFRKKVNMTKKQYLLFIPTLGRYTAYNSLEELEIGRDKLLAVELERLKEQYKILEETIYPNGDSETRPFKTDKKRSTPEVLLTEGHTIEILRDFHPLLKKTETI
jgi:hypothetical protein